MASFKTEGRQQHSQPLAEREEYSASSTLYTKYGTHKAMRETSHLMSHQDFYYTWGSFKNNASLR